MNTTRENLKFDPVTALDRRTGARDRRQSDRGGSASDRRRSGGLFRSKRLKIFGVIAVALISSVGAAGLINTWFESELDRYKLSMLKAAEKDRPAPTVKVIVAKNRMVHGDELSSSNIKLINWQADSVPAGFFSSRDILLNKNGKRIALSTIEPNEPILASKITGPGVKASLSALLGEGKKAITIRVNDVFGVAGLILPNDRVDVLWTMTRPEGELEKEPFTELLLKEVRVLAIDQRFSDDTKKSYVAKAVTIEVDLQQAQKVVLGSKTGSLHLALRGARSAKQEIIGRVRLSKLGYSPAKDGISNDPIVVVIRGVTRKNYSVTKGTNTK